MSALQGVESLAERRSRQPGCISPPLISIGARAVFPIPYGTRQFGLSRHRSHHADRCLMGRRGLGTSPPSQETQTALSQGQLYHSPAPKKPNQEKPKVSATANSVAGKPALVIGGRRVK